jgi:hypothetical protein
MNPATLSVNRGGKPRALERQKQKRRFPEGIAAFCYHHDT